MLKIRLKRVGRRNDPSFRVVVVDSRKGPKSNKFIERVGFYNPKTKERELNGERIGYWMGVGAQVSGTVYNMLVDAGIIKGDKKNVLPQKSPVVKEEEEKKVAVEKTEAAATDNGDTVEKKEEKEEVSSPDNPNDSEEKEKATAPADVSEESAEAASGVEAQEETPNEADDGEKQEKGETAQKEE